jgi:signal recognition particle receptor subunit beta
MVVYNAASRELTAKIVYYGPGLSGKTTNIQFLHGRLEPSSVGNLMTLAATQDRTIYFDLLPVELGDIKGYRIRFQVATVPGQTPYNETRRLVLRGVDGVVFVVDSRWSMLPKNLESFQNLRENLKEEGVSFEGLPLVIQFNKRDLPDMLAVDALQEALGIGTYPFIEAVASNGKGVIETFKLISKLTFVDILRRLQKKDAAKAAKAETPTLTSWKNAMLADSAAKPTERPARETPVSPLRVAHAPAAEPFPTARPSLESPFDSSSPAEPGPAAESEVVFEAPPDLPAIPPSREETNPAYFPPRPEAPSLPPQQASPRPSAAPKATSGTTASLEISKLLADRRIRPPRPSREVPPPQPPAPPVPDPHVEELRRRLAESEIEVGRLKQRLEEAEKARQEETAGRQAVEDSVVRLTNSLRDLEKELAEISGREMEMVAKSNRDSQTFQSMVEKLNFGIIENESRVNELSGAHEARIARLETLIEEQGARASQDRENLRRLLAETDDRLKFQREENERRLAGLDSVRESLAAALSDLAEKLRRAVEATAKN